MGRYGLTGDGVLIKEGVSYLKHRIAKSPSRIYKITGVNSKRISSYYNKLYNSGTPLQNGERVINRYSLLSQNCSTTVCGALRVGGYNIRNIINPKNFIHTFAPKYDSDERFLRTRELMIDSKF